MILFKMLLKLLLLITSIIIIPKTILLINTIMEPFDTKEKIKHLD
jgi:hypothetical protein